MIRNNVVEIVQFNPSEQSAIQSDFVPLYFRIMFSKSNIEKYFVAEKSESLLFMIIGTLAVLMAVILLVYLKNSLAKGMLIPLVVIGIIQIVVGINVYRKSDAQRTEMVYSYDMNPAKLKNEEIPRMIAVMKSFVIIRYTEISLFLIGAILCFVFRNSSETIFWYGFGFALAIQALISLILDFFAEKRGQVYLDGLSGLLN